MKKISVAFDGLKFSTATMQYALKIAQESKALLSGIFLEDFLYHSYTTFDMVGSQGVSATKLRGLIYEDKRTRAQAAAVFEDNSKKQGINYTVHFDKSFALEDLVKESIYSDLLLIGSSETLSHYHEEPPTSFIRNLLAKTQCPVLILPSEYHDISRVIMLYDGQPSSVFAIKMFHYLMPWLSKVEKEIIHVGADVDRTDDKLLNEYITCHHPAAKYKPINGSPDIVISQYLKKAPPGSMAVLGAYGRGSLSRLLKASMADTLMQEIQMPLFIAHSK
ncbi:hypothetical protein BEL04_06940 [Mucilaginibacter sp. PPCGB 2223]|uniref:universal stress protein n=1 Tax=Mucilaginibacter sp. PPCGB 2223 TaxID=1886027 RepID=UPI000826E566|nr:universal stress protein [Mucilaginibacter sp. PPCGB 2223]OCX54005.1 hypothetical protein BEL04_06940 [Mucilaginibacter sp. PPCGB 2223]